MCSPNLNPNFNPNSNCTSNSSKSSPSLNPNSSPTSSHRYWFTPNPSQSSPSFSPITTLAVLQRHISIRLLRFRVAACDAYRRAYGTQGSYSIDAKRNRKCARNCSTIGLDYPIGTAIGFDFRTKSFPSPIESTSHAPIPLSLHTCSLPLQTY